jgi:hypothetical protein
MHHDYLPGCPPLLLKILLAFGAGLMIAALL